MAATERRSPASGDVRFGKCLDQIDDQDRGPPSESNSAGKSAALQELLRILGSSFSYLVPAILPASYTLRRQVCGAAAPFEQLLPRSRCKHIAGQRTMKKLLKLLRAVITRSRSIPVLMPISSSMFTRSSVEIFPLPPGTTGQPPSPPQEESKVSTPASMPARTLASPKPRVL